MKKWIQKFSSYIFAVFLICCAYVGIQKYYMSLPVRGAFETGPVSYPNIDKQDLKAQLSKYPLEQLEEMKKAGLEVLNWQNVLKKVNSNVFADVIKNFDHFFIIDRYPEDESIDYETKSAYFYHTHRPYEHGHFHVYLSDKNLANDYEPISVWNPDNCDTHLIAISMHPSGEPMGFFIPNQWITADEWYPIEAMAKMWDQFKIDHPYPSWASNQWVRQMLTFFRPQLEQVYQERDRVIADSKESIECFTENRKRDVVASVAISVPLQMEVIEELLTEELGQNQAHDFLE